LVSAPLVDHVDGACCTSPVANCALLHPINSPLSGGRKTERQRELRLLKAALARSELGRRLSQPTFAASISDLHGKFVLKVCEFINALGTAHKEAQKERSDTREELESLLNLMSRLDFNGYFSARAPPPPPPKEEGKDGGLAAAGSERMTVQFAQ
jgi:hypothetical protein